MHIADSLGCSAEVNTTLESNYTPIKKKRVNEELRFLLHSCVSSSW